MAPEIEKRQHGRTAVRLPIHILAADGSRLGEIKDISLGGAFIRCKKPPPPDAKVLLTYENLNGNKPNPVHNSDIKGDNKSGNSDLLGGGQ